MSRMCHIGSNNKILHHFTQPYTRKKYNPIPFADQFKNNLDLQKYFRNNPVILLTLENIPSNHEKPEQRAEIFFE